MYSNHARIHRKILLYLTMFIFIYLFIYICGKLKSLTIFEPMFILPIEYPKDKISEAQLKKKKSK